MRWRVILRFSLNGDTGSPLRNAIAAELGKRGFERTKTGTWERDDFDSPTEAMRAIREVTRRLETPRKYGGGSRAIMDHLWVYADQPRRRAPRVDLK
jgi:hypothetical protein